MWTWILHLVTPKYLFSHLHLQFHTVNLTSPSPILVMQLVVYAQEPHRKWFVLRKACHKWLKSIRWFL